MELDDSFTEKLIQRARARKGLISSKKIETVSKKRAALIDENQVLQNAETAYPPEDSPKRQCFETPTKEHFTTNRDGKENIEQNANAAFGTINSPKVRGLAALKKTTSYDADDETQTSPPKRQCLQSAPKESSSNVMGNVKRLDDRDCPFGPFVSNNKVRGLAALKKHNYDDSDGCIEGGIKQRTTAPSQVNTKTYVFSTNSKDLCSAQKTKFAVLSDGIKHWEDNVPKPLLLSNITVSKTDDLSDFPPKKLETYSKPNSISMKLYYTNKAASDSVSENTSSQLGTFKSGDELKPENEVDCSSSSFAHKQSNVGNRNSPLKHAARLKAWNQAIDATLESQDVVKKPIKLVKFAAEQQNVLNIPASENNETDEEDESNEDHCEDSDEEMDDTTVNKLSRAENFKDLSKKGLSLNQVKTTKTFDLTRVDVDPADLPLSARKALFEKALLQGSPKINDSVYDPTLSVAQRAAMFETASKTYTVTKTNVKIPQKFIPTVSPVKLQPVIAKSPVKAISHQSGLKEVNQRESRETLKKPPESLQTVTSPNKNMGSHTRLMQQKLIENASNHWQQKDIKANEERKQEISSLVNHWEKLSSSSSVEKSISDEEKFQDNLGKKSFESEEEGNSECDEESEYGNLAEMDSKEELASNLDEAFMQPEESHSELESELESSTYTNELTSVENTSNDDKYSFQQPLPVYQKEIPRQAGTVSSCSDDSNFFASRSQSYSSSSSVGSYDSVASSIQSEGKESNPDVPLLYTVSFYRKQKQETRTPPLQTIVRKEYVSTSSSDDVDQGEVIQDRIKALHEEILRQQTVISQSSQALNLCSATTEFSGSTEQVEGERLLLIATQKRQACLNEIQRLKSHGAQGQNISDGTGTLTITGIQLPLKREFIAAQLEGRTNDMVHYFLCLIRYGAQVIVTQMVSTMDKASDGSLCFSNHIKLQNLPADFSVVFEVYGLQAKKEFLPHEKKYHIKREHSKIRLTPKGKRSDGKILLPAISSPGGPNAVRSPSFGVIGYTRFTLQNCNRTSFTLDKVPYTSPLDGLLKVKLSLHAEHKIMEKGFLTMFEDVGGFGAWHRRWCALDAHHLSYWKYPDEEHKKEPIGVIDLKQCVTAQVKLVPRDICARPHTFQLLTVRPQERGDKNTLITKSVNTLTSTKHLLSADTKEERILWCNKLNEALTSVRKWDPQALRPLDYKQEE